MELKIWSRLLYYVLNFTVKVIVNCFLGVLKSRLMLGSSVFCLFCSVFPFKLINAVI